MRPLAAPLALAFVAALLVPPAAVLGADPAGAFTNGRYDGRAFALYTPATPAPDAPLVVALHGCWQTPEDFALGTRLNVAAERRGLVVVYPAQTRRDNAYRCWNWFDSQSGEAAQILAVARHVQTERGVRQPHVLVLGFSAGAFMAINLACAAPDVVIGIGVAAGGPYRCGVGAMGAMQCMRGLGSDATQAASLCLRTAGAPALHLRASLWHGGADPVVNVSNLSALEAMLARAIDAKAATAERVDGTVHAVHRDARDRPVLETWLVPPMGHAWSGGDPRGTHTYPPGPPSTERMLDFLLAGR